MKRALIIAATVGSFIAGTVVISNSLTGGPDDPVDIAIDAGVRHDGVIGVGEACPASLFLCPNGLCQETCE